MYVVFKLQYFHNPKVEISFMSDVAIASELEDEFVRRKFVWAMHRGVLAANLIAVSDEY